MTPSSSNPPSPRKPASKPAFKGIARTPYSTVHRDGDCLVIGFGALLPPICVVTGEPVDPKAFPPLTYDFVVKEPTYMEKRVLKQTPEKESFRFFVNGGLRGKALFWKKMERFCACGFVLTGLVPIFVKDFHIDGEIMSYFAGLLCFSFLVLALLYKRKRDKIIQMDRAKVSPTQVWISGLSNEAMDKLCKYSPETQ